MQRVAPQLGPLETRLMAWAQMLDVRRATSDEIAAGLRLDKIQCRKLLDRMNNPHFPALQSSPRLRQAGRSDPMALSGASRRKQIPCSAARSLFLVIMFAVMSPLVFAVSVSGLRCELQQDPLGIDRLNPQLSWVLSSGQQTAYQVIVEGAWDSGKVASDQSVGIEYAGSPLQSRGRCVWKVRVWDQDGKPSPWSRPGEWTMGILAPEDWGGRWIAAREVPMNLPRGQKYKLPDPLVGNFQLAELGYHAAIADRADSIKWVQVDIGSVRPIEKIRIRPLNHDEVEGFGFPLRFRIEASENSDFSSPLTVEDHTAADFPNPGARWVEIDGKGVRGRYIRITATRLFAPPRNPKKYCFGLRTMEVISGGKNAAVECPVTALDSVEAHGWGQQHLTGSGGPIKARQEAVLMRRDIDLARMPARAILRVTSLGIVEPFINGQKAGDNVLAPGLTDYTKRVYYDTYDVTQMLQKGDNTVAAMLGNGYFSCPSRGFANWYGVGNEPMLSMDLELIWADGTSRNLGTDSAWKWSVGEITYNDFFRGEKHDLRQAQPGWMMPGFDDSRWQPAVAVSAPPGKLQSNPGTYVKVIGTVSPLRTEGGQYIFDGVYTGWPRVRVFGRPGQMVAIKGGEGKAQFLYEFTLKEHGEQVLEPLFSWHTIGPVITVEGIDPSHTEVTIIRAGADIKQAGTFACSNDGLNQIHEALLRTHRNYTAHFPNDPTREKTGWTQDVQSMSDSAIYMTDMHVLYRRWWHDFLDSQTPDGAAGSVAPMVWGGQDKIWDDPWWSGMIIYTPWQLYRYYGDSRMLAEAYEPMKAYLNWLNTQADLDGVMRWAGASDWIEVGIDRWGPPKRTPRFLVSTCAWHLYADILSRTAELLGQPEEQRRYSELARRIRETFNTKYFDPETGLYAGALDSQTSLILPLCLGMVPPGKEPLVLERLKENIHQRGDHHSTGFVGTPFLLQGLPDFGMAELSYRICTQKEYPSWNTLTSHGVFMETWAGGMVQMPSCGGGIGQWFYRTLGGILPGKPGFKKIIIKPAIVGDLAWVKCEYDSPYGKIVSNWNRDGSTVTMDVTIPANTSAEIHVPGPEGRIHKVGPGRYRFTGNLLSPPAGDASY